MEKDNKMDSLKMFLKEIRAIPLLTAEEEMELLNLSKSGDKSAKDKLVEHNLRLVVSVAKTFKDESCELLDIIDFGEEGLIKAVEKFDFSKASGNKRLSTFAYPVIRNTIIDKLLKSRGISSHYSKRYAQIRAVEIEFYREKHRYPKDDTELLNYWKENGDKIGIKAEMKKVTSIAKVREKCGNFAKPLYLDDVIGDYDDRHLVEKQVSRGSDIEEIFFEKNAPSRLNNLTPIERLVIYKMSDYEFKTKKEECELFSRIGKDLGMPCEKIEIIYNNAKKELLKKGVRKDDKKDDRNE